MRGFFVLLFKVGGVVITRKPVNHEVVIDRLGLKWADDNIRWLRGRLVPLVDESYLHIDGWVFKPVCPPWWYHRNKSWYDGLVLDRFNKDFLLKAKIHGFHRML